MVVSGLPIRNGDNHAREIARMALRLRHSVCNEFEIRYEAFTLNWPLSEGYFNRRKLVASIYIVLIFTLFRYMRHTSCI